MKTKARVETVAAKTEIAASERVTSANMTETGDKTGFSPIIFPGIHRKFTEIYWSILLEWVDVEFVMEYIAIR